MGNVSALILAGGKSRRMGRDKAFIEVDGEPMIARIIARLEPLSSDLIIVANDRDAYTPLGIKIVGDVYPDMGSLGGIYSGLQAAREEHGLAVACDMPFLNLDLLRYLSSLADDYDVVIPRASSTSGKRPHASGNGSRPRLVLAKDRDLHPLHAVYSKRCLPAMQAHVLAGDLRVVSFFEEVRMRVVEPAEVERFDPQHLSFFNLNTPDDLMTLRRLGAGRSNRESSTAGGKR